MNFIHGNLEVSWFPLENEGPVKVWLVTTNNFKTRGQDEYHLLAEVTITQKQLFIDIKKYPSSFYKVVIEAPHNALNKWLILE